MNLRNKSIVMENYDHIILTDEEKETITTEALRLARKAKHIDIEKRKYWEKVNKPVEYPKYNMTRTLDFFFTKAWEINPAFELNEFNQDIVSLLAAYFSQDELFEKSGYSLKKGILLVGPVGCGKTTIMKAFSLNTTNPYKIVTARNIASEYTDKIEGGDHTIQKYSKLSPAYPQQNFGFDHLGQCFDDIGTETSKKHFGNEIDVIGEIIYNRYDARLHAQTHFTANMTADDIEQAYGSRIKSRLREMCNFITFDVNSPDFRK